MFSLVDKNKGFFYFFGAMVCLHTILMMYQVRKEIHISVSEDKTFKVILVQETPENSLRHKSQIVQSEDSRSTEKSKNAFLSDKDRSFERQTISKTIDSFKQAAKGNAKVSQLAEKAQLSKKEQSLNKLKLSDFGLAPGDPIPKVASRSPASLTKKGLENGEELAEGLSATNDYVEEMQLGDFTHLNTVEYKFYGFFHRIRQKLEQHWGRSIKEKSEAFFRSGRRMPASQDLVTNLQVSLNEKGEIIAVKILGASGVRELDEAAVESFNQAGPFPNPPKELLINGSAIINWGFVVKS